VRELEDENWYDGSIEDTMSLRSQRPSFLRGRIIADIMGVAGRPDPFGARLSDAYPMCVFDFHVVSMLLFDVNY